MLGSDKSKICDADSVDWATLVLMFIGINMSWWLADLPKLWQQGVRAYFDAVIWQCLRVSLPSVVGIFSVYHAIDSNDIPRIYYRGFYHQQERKPTGSGFPVAVISDGMVMVAVFMAIYKACTRTVPDGDPASISGWNVVWLYPTLPAAVIGLCLFGATALNLQKKWVIILSTALVLVVVCVVVSLILYYVSVMSGSKAWVFGAVIYLIYCLPLALIRVIAFQLVATGWTVLIRVGFLGIGILSERGYFPFCEVRYRAFGGIYIGLGVLAVVIAMYGRLKWNIANQLFNPNGQRVQYREAASVEEHDSR